MVCQAAQPPTPHRRISWGRLCRPSRDGAMRPAQPALRRIFTPMTKRWLPISLAAFLIASAAYAAPGAATQPASAPFECRWTEDAITIDGKADDKAWQQAQVIDDFRMAWAKGL